jgi:RNA polymerase sigma-70 factor, ECF subfamily
MNFLATQETKETAFARAPAFIEVDERELVAQAQAGSMSAFERLVEKYERRIFRLAQNITRNREDAEDVMQNALVKAFRKLSAFRGDSSFYTWLVSITVNEALMGVRRRRWNVVSMDDPDKSNYSLLRDEIEDWGPNPEQRYSQTELQEILGRTIGALSPGYRIVFQLRDIESFSTRETAQALSLSSTAVKSRLQRARLQLRKSLNRYFGANARQNAVNLAARIKANPGVVRRSREI